MKTDIENNFSSTIVLAPRDLNTKCENNNAEIIGKDGKQVEDPYNPLEHRNVEIIGKDGKQVEDPYNPLEHRNVECPISDARSLANLLKCSLGSGILAMPLAFENAGILVGTIGCILVGFICTHCAQILVQTSREICTLIKQPSLEYAETCEEAFANGPKCLRSYSKAVRYGSDFGMALTCLGACSVYVVLITNSVKQLIEIHYPETVININLYCLMLVIPLMLLVQIKNLKHLAPFSACANIMFVAIVCITLYVIAKDLPSIGERQLYTNIKTFPSFLSLVIFAMEGIGIVMYIENSMSNPSHFLGCPGVLNISMTIVVIMYGVLGFLGYWKYGHEVMGSVTLNLDPTALPAKIAKGLITVAMYFTYAVQFYVSIEIIWKYTKVNISKRWQNVSSIFLRCLCVILTVLIGAAIPKLDAIISLVGAVFYSTLGLFIPALVQTVFRWNINLGKWNWILWKNCLLMLFSLTALVCGVSVTVYDLVK